MEQLIIYYNKSTSTTRHKCIPLTNVKLEVGKKVQFNQNFLCFTKSSIMGTDKNQRKCKMGFQLNIKNNHFNKKNEQ